MPSITGTSLPSDPSRSSKPSAPRRVEALDALRGLIMILMAIDHASYFIAKVHPGEFWGMPLPQYPDGLSFFTRAVTHLCAPGFFFADGCQRDPVR